MLSDWYFLAEARNKTEVVVKMKTENTNQAWTEFEQTTLLGYRQRDITKS